MFLPPFDYRAPKSLTEAVSLLTEETDAALLAGGTDLLVGMKERRFRPRRVISLRHIPELHRWETRGEWAYLGAAVTVAELEQTPWPTTNAALGDLIPEMAVPQVRNRATVGGNLCTAAACADFPPVLLVSQARVILTGPQGEREIPLKEFFTGPRQTVRRPDEILTTIIFQAHNPGSAYVKFGWRRTANIAVVGVAAALELDGEKISRAAVSVTAASPAPVVLEEKELELRGERPTEEVFQKAAEKVYLALKPISDLRGSAAYRLHLARVGTIRAFQRALERWRKEEVHA